MQNKPTFNVWDDDGRIQKIVAQGSAPVIASPQPCEHGEVQWAVRLSSDGTLTVWTNTEPWFVEGKRRNDEPNWELRCILDLKAEITIRELAHLGGK